MAEDDRQPRRRRPPLDLVQLGVADAAGVHADQYFARSGDRVRVLSPSQRPGIVAE